LGPDAIMGNATSDIFQLYHLMWSPIKKIYILRKYIDFVNFIKPNKITLDMVKIFLIDRFLKNTNSLPYVLFILFGLKI
jgi:hypothetical protein